MFDFLKKIFGDPNKKYLDSLQSKVERINELEDKFKDFSFKEIKKETKKLKKSLENETLDDILPEAFALVRETSKRTLDQRHYDEQLLAGIAMHEGKIAEMKTGEGKTLAATLPLYLNALEEKGVHLVTVNDYLARRDTVWMGQIYHKLGLKTACINRKQSFVYDPDYKKADEEKDQIRDRLGSFHVVEDYLRPVSRKEAYQADILYGTNNTFGFDYLRDNMRMKKQEKVQRDFNFAILDEIDSILIDEARTPLIISKPDKESSKMYKDFSRITPKLKEDKHFNLDEKAKAVMLTEEGIEKVEDILGVENIYESKGVKYLHYLEQSLKAKSFFKKDRDYVVKDGKVVIVDEFTGRLMPGRRYSGGLHQAIEAKEGLEVKAESKTLATITFQNFFRMYDKLAGMTGTAKTSSEEFEKVYDLETIVIPTHKPLRRKSLADKIFKTRMGKFKAIARDIKERNEKGQPVLVGTSKIEKSEVISKILNTKGIDHNVLNAKNHQKEGEIIAQAGKKGAVTVATNMAGRGVDIVLGGNPPDKKEAKEVKELGGLHVIGAQRHESRRIDNQLKGRSGRQGDPGSSQFFASLEDPLLRIFGGDRIDSLMSALNVPEDQPIEAKILSGAIENAQKRVEGRNFDVRAHVLKYDNVVSKHRNKIYTERGKVLQKDYDELKSYALNVLREEIEKIVDIHSNIEENTIEYDEIAEDVKSIMPTATGFKSEIEKFDNIEKIKENIFELAKKNFKKKEEKEGKEAFGKVLKFICLKTFDFLWAQHLESMDHLKDSVKLKAYGGKDPLVEYKSWGHKEFQKLEKQINSQIARTMFKLSANN